MKFKLKMDLEDYLGRRTVTLTYLDEIELFESIARWIRLSTRESAQCKHFKIMIEEDKQ